MKKSNNCLNMAKGIACFFVVFMHIPFPNTFGIVVKKIGEFAVPLFYMISGFFLWKPELKEVKLGLIKKINRLFNVCLKVSIVYLLWNIFISRFGSGHLILIFLAEEAHTGFYLLFYQLMFCFSLFSCYPNGVLSIYVYQFYYQLTFTFILQI